MITLAFLAAAAATFGLIELTPLGRAVAWRAMITPLASIIGSGFLVAAPLLAREFGGLAILAMAGLCLAGWWLGGVIRFNIAHVEPMIADGSAPPEVAALERVSQVVLVFAYVISVAYYLALLGAFVSRAFGGAPDPAAGRAIATALLAAIGWLGWSGGLGKVLTVESLVVSFKLAVIAGLLAALALHDAQAVAAGQSVAPPRPQAGAASLPALLGLLILVQGFETSRFLGESFDARTRIVSMRRAQLIASAIYVGFFALMSPLLGAAARGAGETAIIDVAALLAPLLPLALTLGAAASQFSAAAADAIGCAGLAAGTTRQMTSRFAFPVIALVAGLVIWETDIYGVIALASRGFALFYMLQCLVGAAATVRLSGWSPVAFWRLGLAGLCAAVAAFGAPAAA